MIFFARCDTFNYFLELHAMDLVLIKKLWNHAYLFLYKNYYFINISNMMMLS
jgi:hypothetical protein